jgi:sugar (pentulose or hexulose) kinase
MDKDLVIGIDSSTTSCKAVVWDASGTLVSQGRYPVGLQQPHPTWHEQAAEEWWSAGLRALGSALEGVDKARLAALCITPQRETFVPVDRRGNPLRQAIVWMDERARPLLPRIDREFGKDRIHQQSGKPLSGNLSLSKIAWLRAHEPEVFADTHHFLDVAGYLNFRLTNQYATGWGCADPTGLFDMRENRWSKEILEYLELTDYQMAKALPVGEVLGEVTKSAAEASGLPVGLPVVAGVGDGQAAALGANLTAVGDTYLNLGTAAVTGTLSREYLTDNAYRTTYAALPGAYLLETVLLGGSYTITWFVEKIACESNLGMGNDISAEKIYESAAADIPPGTDGLMLVPYWNTAMSPYWDAAASGMIVGWRGYHTLAHVYRAILEGIGFELRLQLQGVEAARGEDAGRIVAMGGGTKSRMWCQMLADMTGKSLYLCKTVEASALGAAILAAYGAGLFPDVVAAAAAMTHVEPHPLTPDMERHALYTTLYEEVYRHLFPALQPYLQKLTELSHGQAES